MRTSADRMISRGCRRITSAIGAFSIRRSATSFWNTGVSRMPSRTQRPTPTSTIDSANGMRQPQTANWSPDQVLNTRMARLARNKPAGTPNCGHEAISPRLPCVLAHSMEISTEPPHSPPTPMPWMTRNTVSRTAPQMPIEA